MDFEGLMVGFIIGMLLPYAYPAIVKLIKGKQAEGDKSEV